MRGSSFFFFSFFLPGAPLGPPPPGLPKNIVFYYENIDFKARIWVREEERREKKRKEKEK